MPGVKSLQENEDTEVHWGAEFGPPLRVRSRHGSFTVEQQQKILDVREAKKKRRARLENHPRDANRSTRPKAPRRRTSFA